MGYYEKEIDTLQTWLYTQTGLSSYRLNGKIPEKLARPVVVWENPRRQKDRMVTAYAYVTKVRQYGKLFINSLDEAATVQEQLISSLEEAYNTLTHKDGVLVLKAVTVEFNSTDTLDIPFSVQYEVTYSRTKPVEPPAATYVGTKVTTSGGGS